MILTVDKKNSSWKNNTLIWVWGCGALSAIDDKMRELHGTDWWVEPTETDLPAGFEIFLTQPEARSLIAKGWKGWPAINAEFCPDLRRLRVMTQTPDLCESIFRERGPCTLFQYLQLVNHDDSPLSREVPILNTYLPGS